jgi:hypothetical protein
MEEFLDALKQARLLTEILDDNFDWKETAFRDGMFVLVKGKVKILDYKYIAATLVQAQSK